ncbi:cell division protein FtsQ/DivIB [Pseudostreptobacillus hongkongensis]|uniref:cell division protein FtsQ/DivIB n=1 Tax=Pseudostreptobacillus hongkongensis TaxID=1162717 RepID=UPI00082EB767|nr:FtsQ-type POTRA domain-containing protein [Pseudostreptobacillus hongkongensis]
MKNIVRLFFLILFVYCTFLFIESDFFIVKNIQIEGNYNLVKDDIVKKLDNIKGDSLFYINASRLEGIIEDDIRVESAKISRKFPDTIKIKIEERKPIAIVYSNGNYFYVDEGLNLFALYKEIKDTGVPIINIPKEDEIEEFKIMLKTLRDTQFYNTISEIYKGDKMYILTLLDGTNVYIDKNVSLKKYNIAYKIYVDESVNKDIEYIDLRFKDIIVK